VGQADGEAHVWIDGIKTHEYTDLEMLQSNSTLSWNRLVVGATWGGIGDTIVEYMYRRYDHFYMSGGD